MPYKFQSYSSSIFSKGNSFILFVFRLLLVCVCVWLQHNNNIIFMQKQLVIFPYPAVHCQTLAYVVAPLSESLVRKVELSCNLLIILELSEYLICGVKLSCNYAMDI